MTNPDLTNLQSVVEQALFDQPRKTSEDLRALILGLKGPLGGSVSDEECEDLAKLIEEKDGIRAGLGAVVDSDEFEPWLDDAKASIDPFYWTRYKKLLLRDGLPKDVVISLDSVTDTILGRLGNPNAHSQWDRRGMVVGHVQSGKTANYAGLIAKAADAGYRLIIVIAGIHNNLRNQTQQRIDEGFIGRDTGRLMAKDKSKAGFVGVGKFAPGNTPVSLTNTIRDFNKETASTNTSEIDSYRVPVVLVIKKNYRTLSNLLDWLKENSARGDREMIDQPMLLIDDEADNASINTKYKKEMITTINGQIRDLLKMFHRSCYVGYTATPFANIFVDPDQNDEMFKEDLFPRDFIIGLDAPSNYFGAKKIFVDGLPDEGEPTWLRYIHGFDNEDILPIKHKIDHEIHDLPQSLLTALRTFLLSRTIRNLRGQEGSHCSMLVNASRFTRVQGILRNRLHDALERIQDAVRVNASLGQSGLNDPELAALHEVWSIEYKTSEPDWPKIQLALLDAISAAKVVEVNSRANDLDYANSGEKGQTVIAVGGFSLSRGLTLEGLTVTWFLRNTMMYDTLMQMGRWFGYRNGFEDLCRIWMPKEAIDWYSFIATATDELHNELKLMEKARATPKMFGLAVRSHPSSLLITARNKMGSGTEVTSLVGLSNKFVETAKVSIRPEIIDANAAVAKKLIESLGTLGFKQEHSQKVPGGHLVRGVPVEFVDFFLAGWRNAEESITTATGPIRNYIRPRQNSELKSWDVLVAGKEKGDRPDSSLGWVVHPTSRYVNLKDLPHKFLSFSGNRMRVSSRGIEKTGVDPEKAKNAEAFYRDQENKSINDSFNYPDRIYRSVRDNPLLIIHLVQPKSADGEEDAKGVSLIPAQPLVAWSLSLPVSKLPDEGVSYVVNTTKLRELFGDDDEDEDVIDVD